MATDLRRSPAPAESRRPAQGKNDAFVEAQLTRARVRIRMLDVTAASLGFLILTLAYALVMVLADRLLALPAMARQGAFALYAVVGIVYLSVVLIRPLSRRINPYYAARRLEDTLPEAKNSVVNWLDLRGENVAPAFRSAIGYRAAKDLAEADLDQAISTRRTAWLGWGSFGLFLGLLVLFVLGPRQFFSLIHRAFAPFVEASIASRTTITLMQPEGGNITIAVGRAVAFAVWVDGKVPDPKRPDALRLLYRYAPGEGYQDKLLERDASSNQWVTSLAAADVHTGFWYKIAGGDTQTPEYRVQVRSSPLLTGFEVTYHYRPYLATLGWHDQTSRDPNLKEIRGTEVTLLARTNRAIKDGRLTIAGAKPIEAELVPNDPNLMRFRLTLDKDGTYQVWFTSAEGERNIEPLPYTIRVLQDHPPQVQLQKPGEDIKLPANGVLQLEGSASDDFGVAGMTLRMKLDETAVLQPKPYRLGKSLKLGDGSFPQMLDYKDFVELEKLRLELGRNAALKPGQVIEYWLEAADNCDYPAPNLGESKHFKVTIEQPSPDKDKQEQQKAQARNDQEKHEKKQDQKLEKEKRNDAGKPQEEGAKSDSAEQQKDGAKQQEDKKDNQSQQPQSEDDKLKEQAEKLNKALKKQEQKQSQTGDKPNGNDKSDSPRQEKDQPDQPQQENPQNQNPEKGNGGAAQKKDGDSKDKSKSAGNPDKRESGNQGDSGAGSGAEQDKNDQHSADQKPGKNNSSGTKGQVNQQENPEKNPSGSQDKSPKQPQTGSSAGDRSPEDKGGTQQQPKTGKSPESKDKQAGSEQKNPDGSKKDQGSSGADSAKEDRQGKEGQKPQDKQKDKTAGSKDPGANGQPDAGQEKNGSNETQAKSGTEGAAQTKTDKDKPGDKNGSTDKQPTKADKASDGQPKKAAGQDDTNKGKDDPQRQTGAGKEEDKHQASSAKGQEDAQKAAGENAPGDKAKEGQPGAKDKSKETSGAGADNSAKPADNAKKNPSGRQGQGPEKNSSSSARDDKTAADKAAGNQDKSNPSSKAPGKQSGTDAKSGEDKDKRGSSSDPAMKDGQKGVEKHDAGHEEGKTGKEEPKSASGTQDKANPQDKAPSGNSKTKEPENAEGGSEGAAKDTKKPQEGATKGTEKPQHEGARSGKEEKPSAASDKEGAAKTGDQNKDSNDPSKSAGPSKDADQGKRKDSGSDSGKPSGQESGSKNPGDNKDSGGKENLSDEKIQELMKTAKAGSSKERADAVRTLEEMRRLAKDPESRQALEKAVKEAGEAAAKESQREPRTDQGGKAGEKTPGDQKGGAQGQETQGQKNEPSSSQEKNSGSKNSGSKPGEGPAKQGESKKDTPSDPANGQATQGGESGQRGGSQPTNLAPDGGRKSSDKAIQPPPPERQPSFKPDTSSSKKAGDLQLEDLKKKVNKDVLKEANMTEEEYQNFLKSYQEMLKRKSPASSEKEKLDGPNRGNGGLPNQRGVRQVDPGARNKDVDHHSAVLPPPPPEFREAQKKFSRLISESGQSVKEKENK